MEKQEIIKELEEGLKNIKDKKLKSIKNVEYELSSFYRNVERMFIVEIEKNKEI